MLKIFNPFFRQTKPIKEIWVGTEEGNKLLYSIKNKNTSETEDNLLQVYLKETRPELKVSVVTQHKEGQLQPGEHEYMYFNNDRIVETPEAIIQESSHFKTVESKYNFEIEEHLEEALEQIHRKRITSSDKEQRDMYDLITSQIMKARNMLNTMDNITNQM